MSMRAPMRIESYVELIPNVLLSTIGTVMVRSNGQ